MGPVDVNMWAWEVLRYKYKFYKAGEHDVSNKDAAITENTTIKIIPSLQLLYLLKTTRRPSDKLNNYVFCFYRGRQRRHTVFRVNPPEEGAFFLKVKICSCVIHSSFTLQI